MERSSLSPATVAVTSGRPEPDPNASPTTPVMFASTYAASPGAARDGDLGYGRWANPTWTAFEEALGALEGGDSLLFGSGMAATASVLALVPPGGVVVTSAGAFYNGTMALLAELERLGAVEVRRAPMTDVAAVTEALDGAALLWLETPSNPLLEVADLPALASAGRAAGAVVAADNTFATPIGQRPLTHGADIVVHSVTKYLSGHSDVVLGATVTRDGEIYERLHAHRTLHGSIPGPMEAMLALRGLRTLHLRVERACANAADLARRLSERPELSRVRHLSLPHDPGHALAAAQMDTFGAIVSIEVAGGPEAAERLCAATLVWLHATSLGGVESSLERRRRHAGEPTDVPDNLVRLSVGIEDVDDLWSDLVHALSHL
jgi:cystathionine gamma-synthase